MVSMVICMPSHSITSCGEGQQEESVLPLLGTQGNAQPTQTLGLGCFYFGCIAEANI